MKPRFLFLTMGLVAALTVASCSAPATPTVDTPPPVSAPTEASAPQTEATAEPTMVDVPTQAVEVQPVPTSRGPKLEATDPATVSLASGQLQLIEFFRFT